MLDSVENAISCKDIGFSYEMYCDYCASKVITNEQGEILDERVKPLPYKIYKELWEKYYAKQSK